MRVRQARGPTPDRKIIPTRVANPVHRDFDLASVLVRSTNELNLNFKRLSTAIRPSMAVPGAAGAGNRYTFTANILMNEGMA